MPYFNVTSNVGLMFGVGTATVATGASFTIEGQSSTNQLLVRNLWIPNGFSTDLYVAFSTGAGATVLVASGLLERQNSFYFIISSSTQTITIKNNSGTTAIYGADGVVMRV